MVVLMVFYFMMDGVPCGVQH